MWQPRLPVLLLIAMGLPFVSNPVRAQGLFGFEPFAVGAESSGEGEIETDRDSFTPATTTAGSGRWIAEAAYTFLDNRDVAETHSYPELLVRRGVGDWFELRFGANYEIGGAGSPTSGNLPSGFGNEAELESEARIFYGAKAMLNEQSGWLPESAILVQGFTPTYGEATDTELGATYIFGWVSESGFTWDSALRYATSNVEEDSFNVWSPSTVVKVPLGERWKAHLEYFGIFSEGRENESTQHFLSPGAHYLLTPDFEIGVRLGWGLNDQAPNFFTNTGIGWRF